MKSANVTFNCMLWQIKSILKAAPYLMHVKCFLIDFSGKQSGNCCLFEFATGIFGGIQYLVCAVCFLIQKIQVTDVSTLSADRATNSQHD